MRQVLSILLLWIGVLSCQSEDINIYMLHVKDDSKALDGWKLIWSEEFDQKGPEFNADNWVFEQKGSSPWNKYLTGNVEQAYVENGRLILRAEKKDGTYMAGGISTRGKAGFKYGKLEVCAKFNSFQGGWPGIWMLPVQRQYPNPPGANEYGGEIDIMEQVSLEKVAWHTVHSHYTLDLGLDKNPPRAGGGAYKENEFNLYTLEWTPEELTFLINGEETFSYPNMHLENEAEMKQWPFDVPYYLILNYALGGEGTWPGEIDDSGLPGQMEIEYIRYYQQEEVEKPGDGDDEEEEDPTDNLIENGDFEKEFAEDKKPGIWAAWQTQGNNTLNYLNMWFAKTGDVLVLDGSTGAKGSSSSLKYAANVQNSWDVDLSYPMQGVEAGKYKFSFYVKTNQDETPFVTSITLCENDEDIAKEAKYQKTIVLQDGKQEMKTGVNDIWGTQINRAGKEWKQYSMIVNIPNNKLVKFVFKPCAGNNNSLNNYDCKKTDNVVYWFDKVTLELTDEEGPGEEEEERLGNELVENGSFEEDFAANKQPGIYAAWQTQGNNTLNFLNTWFAKPDVTNPALSLDTSTGANGSSRSLKYTADQVANTWGIDLSYPMQGVPPGKYRLSFYVKTNQTESPFVTSVTLCENDDDVAKEAKYQKTLVLQDGIQTIEVGVNDIWGTAINQAGNEWKKYSVAVDIPANVLVKFVFKPCAGANNNLTGYDAKKTDNVIYWFDDVSLKAILK